MERPPELEIDIDTFAGVVQLELNRLQEENINLKVANRQLSKNLVALKAEMDNLLKNKTQPLVGDYIERTV